MVYRGRSVITSGVAGFDGKEVKKVFYWTREKFDAELTNAIDSTDADLAKGVRNDCYYFVVEGGTNILKKVWTAAQAIAASSVGVLAEATPGEAELVVTSGILALPCPRNLTVTGTGTAADVPADSVVIAGTNIHDEVITESFLFTVNDNTAIVGAKAFKTVTSITFPAGDGADWQATVGFGDILGLDWELPVILNFKEFLGGTLEGTAATYVADDDEVEKNTMDLNSALDGSEVIAYMLV